jgi:hypothetical protein
MPPSAGPPLHSSKALSCPFDYCFYGVNRYRKQAVLFVSKKYASLAVQYQAVRVGLSVSYPNRVPATVCHPYDTVAKTEHKELIFCSRLGGEASKKSPMG